MPCAIAAVSNSPMFASSPRKLSPIFCKPAGSPPPARSVSSPSRLAFKQIGTALSGNVEEKDLGAANLKTVMKRKRPARIDIPSTMSLSFDNLTTVSDLDRSSEVEVEGEGYSVYAKRGKRGSAMEDRYAAVLASESDSKSKQAFFGVFDGHGGAAAAEFSAENLLNNISIELSNSSDSQSIEQAVKRGYLNTDSDFLKQEIRGGACSVTAIIHEDHLVVSNVGDCRAVMCRGGIAEALTVDHRPALSTERDRIENLGGYIDCCHGVWRVHGTLAVSRAIGDRHLKKWVIAEPETKVLKMEPDIEFLIMASDGLWDKVTNQEAVDVVRPLCNDKARLLSACKKLVDLSLTRGSTDDTSVMIIQLSRFIR